MKCEKCGDDNFKEWKSGETYKGLDEHHNPPEFITERLGEKWEGERYLLCRECHILILHKIIKQILFRNSNSAKFVNSEYWLMNKMTLEQLKIAREEIYNFTKLWLKNDTKTT